MMPQINKKIIIAIIISSIAYYFYFNDFFSDNISTSIDIHMILFICTTYYLYMLLCFIFDRKLGSKEFHTLGYMYIIFLITLLFSKDVNTNAGYINTFNLDIRSLTYSLNNPIGILFIVMNIVLLIPIGWMCRKFDVIVKLLFPILLFLIIEYIQYINGVGIFDINDIILNSIGFYIGAFIFSKFK